MFLTPASARLSPLQSLRDARQELRDARRDGRLGEELSEQAKERSGRVQVRCVFFRPHGDASHDF